MMVESSLTVSRDVIVAIVSNLIFFRLGIYFCDKLFVIRPKIAHKLGAKNLISRFLFATIFTLSCSIFLAVVMEILQLSGQELRIWSWKFCLVVLISFLIVILPFYQISLLVSDIFTNVRYRVSWKVYIPTFLGLYAIYLYAFWWLTNPFPLTKDQNLLNSEFNTKVEQPEELIVGKQEAIIKYVQDACMYNQLVLDIHLTKLAFFLLQRFLARIAIVGVTVIALLSGFGAVNCPITFLGVLFTGKKTEEDMITLESRLDRTLTMIASKKHNLVKLQQQLHSEERANSQSGASPSLFGKIFSTFTGSKGNNLIQEKIANLNTEISTLEDLSEQIYLDLYECCSVIDRIRFSRTIRGKVYKLAGMLLAVYCIYRIIMALRKTFLVLRSNTSPDPVTRVLTYLSANFGLLHDVDLVFWSQQLSFAMIFIMIVLSVRSLLLSLQKVSRMLFGSISASTMIVLFSHIMGTYFTASVMLLRQNLPVAQRMIMTNVLGGVEFLFYEQWFDILFVLSTICSIAYFIIFSKIVKAQAQLN